MMLRWADHKRALGQFSETQSQNLQKKIFKVVGGDVAQGKGPGLNCNILPTPPKKEKEKEKII